MAGTDRRFDAARFREAIKFAMQMGFPDETSQQLTWTWDTARTYTNEDSSGLPFEFTPAEVASEENIDPLIVDCAVKFNPGVGGQRVAGTALGTMDIVNLTATLLDTDYDALLAHGDGDFPDGATIDDVKYRVQYVMPPYGLFEVTVYDVVLQAGDEV